MLVTVEGVCATAVDETEPVKEGTEDNVPGPADEPYWADLDGVIASFPRLLVLVARLVPVGDGRGD